GRAWCRARWVVAGDAAFGLVRSRHRATRLRGASRPTRRAASREISGRGLFGGVAGRRLSFAEYEEREQYAQLVQQIQGHRERERGDEQVARRNEGGDDIRENERILPELRQKLGGDQ